MEILDNTNILAQRDPQNALGVIGQAADQLTWEAIIENASDEVFTPTKIVLCGMGGSALGGSVIRDWLDLAIPFEIVRDYTLPRYVDADTLVIASSVSGNTEETLSAYDDAKARQSRIVIMAKGGKLLDIAKEEGRPYIELPDLEQPRYGVFAHMRAITKILETYGVARGSYDELASVHDTARDFTETIAPSTETLSNPAKQLALDCAGKTPVVYASVQNASLAFKWKISFNENAKNVAFCSEYSEFNHNEFIGWTSHPVEKPFAIIDLRSNFDSPRINERFELSDRLLSGMRPHAKSVHMRGDTRLAQMINSVIMADFTSIYLAMLNGVNPAPVDLVEKLKAELS